MVATATDIAASAGKANHRLKRAFRRRENREAMTLLEHMEELRRVLAISLGAWLVGTVVGVLLSGLVLRVLTTPLGYLHQGLHYFSPMGYFSIHLKVGAIVGLALVLPVILWQLWSFVSPGLTQNERRLARPLLASALALFALGALLAYFFLYIAVRMIALFTHDSSLVYFPEANAYISFVIVLMLAFGIAFEFPVALVVASLVGLVKSTQLARKRRPALFGIVAAGYILTPGVDPVTPLALIVPLLFMYEGSILVIRRLGR
jgi:sec-independent protein translocase protein TatC